MAGSVNVHSFKHFWSEHSLFTKTVKEELMVVRAKQLYSKKRVSINQYWEAIEMRIYKFAETNKLLQI